MKCEKIGIAFSCWHLEEMVKEQTAELEHMNRLLVGRQLIMIELKKRITELEKEIS